MNYRHGYHAGNHADVLKHAALMLLLQHLKAKPKPFFVLDTHGGRGGYDLASAEALRAGEFRHGIARLMAAGEVPAGLVPYLAAVRAANPPGALTLYPGSPLLIAGALRPEDRLVACELHPGESAALAAALRPWRRARVETRDGYGALKGVLPPPEKRGLVLIDPPFEKPDEFQTLGRALREAWKRFPQGVYLVWYPLKDRAAADAFLAGVAEGGVRDATAYELYVRAPVAGGGMTGSGVLAVNGAFALDAAMAALLPFLARTLAQGPGANGAARRIAAE